MGAPLNVLLVYLYRALFVSTNFEALRIFVSGMKSIHDPNHEIKVT